MPSVSDSIKESRRKAEGHFDRAQHLVLESARYDEAMVHAVLAVAARLEQLTTIISIKD